MTTSFKNVAFFFSLGFGLMYLGADFLINQGRTDAAWIRLIYQTFDMPFFFSAGMYALASIHLFLGKRWPFAGLQTIFWILAAIWTVVLLYLNLGFQSWL